jgi:hypothetical protein
MKNPGIDRGWSRFVILQVVTVAIAWSGKIAVAQEKVGTEETGKIARKLIEALGKPTGLQVTVDADTDRGECIRHGELGLLVLPDRKLTAEKLNAAGEEPVAVGHLFLKGISPVAAGSVVPNAQHRLVNFTVDDKTFEIAACLLGARKRNGTLELVVFGSGKTPILVTPLEADSSGSTAPIEIAASKESDDTDESM